MNKYNSDIHYRKSIRLKGYDYSQTGIYFITICVKDWMCLFGNVIDGKMILNDAGKIVNNEWMKLHEFVVMPNHYYTCYRH